MDYKINKIIKAAEAGGRIIKRYFGGSLEIVKKTSLVDLRTQADTGSEKAILKILTKEFPDYNIFCEEIGYINKDSEYTFIIDPLDGTHNFVLGIPNFTVSIALLKKGIPVAGVVHAPMINETYHAIADHGAYIDGKKLKVSEEKKIKKAAVAYNCGYKTSFLNKNKHIKKIMIVEPKRTFMNWSVAYDFCLLAEGRIESIINFEVKIYDFAAGKIIAKEAGAIITDFRGKKEKDFMNENFIISCTQDIHKKMISALK